MKREVAGEPAGVGGPEPPTDLSSVEDIGPTRSAKLRAAGIASVKDLLAAHPQELAERIGVSLGTVKAWQSAARRA